MPEMRVCLAESIVQSECKQKHTLKTNSTIRMGARKGTADVWAAS